MWRIIWTVAIAFGLFCGWATYTKDSGPEIKLLPDTLQTVTELPPPYQIIEDQEWKDMKWQVTALVDRVDGKLPTREQLLAAAKKIAANKMATLGPVDRWWVTFKLAEHPDDPEYFATVHKNEEGKVSVKGKGVR